MTQLLAFTPRGKAAGCPSLGADALHLWRIQTGATGADPAGLWPLLSPTERTRAGRLATATLRDRYVRAHGGLRLILGLYLDQSPQTIVFSTSAQGKPSLFQPPAGLPERLGFNLTGSHDLALAAISLDLPVGVDCELIRPCPELLSIARRMFSPQVAQALERTPEPDRLEAFYAAWTALEAQVKADGRGLFRPREPNALPLATAHCLPQPGYIAALARHRLPPPRLWRAFEWSSGA